VPQPLHYAVIFTSRRKPLDEGYPETAARMEELARRQPGFLGVESARSEDGLGITISYWESPEAIAAWGRNAEHLIAQKYGREKWYEWFSLRIAAVHHVRSFGTGAAKDEGPPAVADGPS
jgi:heme-degrading monooxygenase HmoA